MLRAVIVDDEAPARRYLRRLLDATASVRIEGEAATLEQARRLIRDHQPDVLFLDVMLAHETGFDLLQQIEHTPSVVFVTAHSDYATQAFDIEAVDYLLKPVNPERLAQTLARLKPQNGGYLSTRSKSGTRVIRVSDLTVALAQGDYVLLCSAENPGELMHTTLKRLAEQLSSPPFHSVSRSMIINLEHISHLVHRPGSQVEVFFTNGVQPILLGRTASIRLRRALS